MVENNREVINKKNRELQNTPPFFELSGWGDKNRMSPVPVLSGTQRRLFYSLQPFDFFIFKFSDILMVIATMHNFSCPLRTQNNRLLVNYFSVKLRIREFLLIRAYQTQGCREANYLLQLKNLFTAFVFRRIGRCFRAINPFSGKEAITLIRKELL